jgi:hypothetical protein
MRFSTREMIWAVCLALPLAVSTAALAENVGTSQADLANYAGAFSIENTTGVTIPYSYRWGDKHPWKSMSLASGHVETHSYPLGQDPNAKVPTPYVRFDRIGGDQNYTAKEYRMEFYAIGYAGYGPKKANTEPKRYVFRYGPDGKSLDIKGK